MLGVLPSSLGLRMPLQPLGFGIGWGAIASANVFHKTVILLQEAEEQLRDFGFSKQPKDAATVNYGAAAVGKPLTSWGKGLVSSLECYRNL